jgi:hypothetical protein
MNLCPTLRRWQIFVFIEWDFEGSDRAAISCQSPRVAEENSYKHTSILI